MITGNLEVFNSLRVSGWILDRKYPEREFDLKLAINGIEKIQLRTEPSRDDVLLTHGVVGHGFDFSISDLITSEINSVSLKVVDSQFQFPNADDIFFNYSAVSTVVKKIKSNKDYYNFPSEINKHIISSIPATSDIGRSALTKAAKDVKFIFIVFSNRTGSNLVTEMIEHMGYGAGATNEPFLPETIKEVCSKHDLSSIDHYLAETISAWKKNEIFFAKASWEALFSLSSIGLMDDILDSAIFIFTRRQDKILQAISNVKARRNGIYFTRGEKPQGPTNNTATPLWQEPGFLEDIISSLHNIYVTEYRIQYFLSIWKKECFEIFYEKMAENINGTYEELKCYLQSSVFVAPSATPFSTTLKKQATGEEEVIKAIFLRAMRLNRFPDSEETVNGAI